MKPFTKYNYSIVISDTAGLKLSNFKLSKYTDYPYTDFEVNFSPSFVASTTTFNHVYTYTGDISDPYKSLLITGSFVTSVIQGADIPISFLIEARDYTPNRTNLAIDGNLTDSPAGGYGWVEF